MRRKEKIKKYEKKRVEKEEYGLKYVCKEGGEYNKEGAGKKKGCTGLRGEK